jgi:mycofactocin precursor peptide peptidase
MLAIPVGSTEQHGAHLPLSTDTDVAVALCERLAAARGDVVIAPPLAYGSSGEHAGFPGTLSMGQTVVEMVVVELGRSATETFPRLVFVSAHGGNTEAVTRAMRTLQAESRDVLLYLPRWDGDPHAGHQETSMMLELAPSLVRTDRAVRGDVRPIAETWPLLHSGGVRAVTDTGVLGDPTKANPEDGRDLLDALAARLIDEVAAWHPAVPA